MKVIVIAIAAIMLLYILALRGLSEHPGLNAFRGWRYAHRGLHNEFRPENSMAAFRAAVEAGYGIEFDLHLLKDGNLGVMHDSDLLRTTGQKGRMEDLTTEDLGKYHLGGTEETIPEFRQVLELYRGRAPLIIELKSVDHNYAALTETAVKMMDGYAGPWCMESFDPRCVRWLRKNRPDIIRGQLAENFLKRSSAYGIGLRFVMTYGLSNFWNRPNFIAYRFEDRKNLSNWLARRLWGVMGVSWTIRSVEDLKTAEKEGWLPIFEHFIPE